MTLQPGSRPVPNCPDYELVRKLGAGAFGEVWHAHGPGGLDVALKFIRLSDQVLALELRSLEAVKNIRHPNLVSLFGVWYSEGWLILAMELCDRTLWDLLAHHRSHGMPGIRLKHLLGYVRDAAEGLDALNARQVQHRDVKPANLLLLNSGVKVADFGLAKVLANTVASNTGGGTIAYTAPECFKGKLSQQSDQYSLAVTYYHLRTGRPLFKGDQAQVMYGHLEAEPDLSALPLEERSILARALAKQPTKRWPSCRDFASALTYSHERVSQVEQSRALAKVPEKRETTSGGKPTINVSDHLGGETPSSADFFALPPPEIGPLLSASTTLSHSDKPLRQESRLFVTISTTIASLMAFAMCVFLANAQSRGWILFWTVGAPIISGMIAWAKTGFKHTCTYVGSLGLARYDCKGDRDRLLRSSELLFRDGANLHTSVTDHYQNGAYQRTSFRFVWRTKSGERCFSIEGGHRSKNKPPPATNLYNFGRAAELAWTRHLLGHALEDIETLGWFQFSLKGDDWVRVGPEWVDFHLKGQTNRCTKEEIGEVTVGGGWLNIKRKDARTGWFSSSGIFEFRYSELANAHLFLLLFHEIIAPLRL
jgi:serine/threonine protein kinase